MDGLTEVRLTLGEVVLTVRPGGEATLECGGVSWEVFWAGSGAVLEIWDDRGFPAGVLGTLEVLEKLLERMDICAAPDATVFEVSD